jgi:hypothetical protein
VYPALSLPGGRSCTAGSQCATGQCLPAAAAGTAAAPSSPLVCAFEDGASCGAQAYSAAAGGAINNAALCASGVCGGGGFCCSRAAAAVGCAACAPATGSCATRSPGEACGVHFDCASGLCSGGCCCSAPVAMAAAGLLGSSVPPPTCAACQCFATLPANASAPAAPAAPAAAALGSCTRYLVPPPTPLPTLPPTTASTCVTCASYATAEAVSGVFILPAASPLNPLPGQDLALGKPGVCQDLALAAAAAGVTNIPAILPCLNATRVLYVDGGQWELLGPAAGLQMGAQPSNCLPSPSPSPSALPLPLPLPSYAASYGASASFRPSFAPSAEPSAAAASFQPSFFPSAEPSFAPSADFTFAPN